MTPFNQNNCSSNGFTLIEVLLAISLFSLLMLIGYQGIISTATGRANVIEKTERQANLRDAHSSLSNSLAAMTPIQGNSTRLNIDLSQAKSPWLMDADSLSFYISQTGELQTELDGASNGALLSGLGDAQFSYYSGGDKFSAWERKQRPELIELSWREGDQIKRWRFICK